MPGDVLAPATDVLLHCGLLLSVLGIPTVTALIQRRPILRVRGAEHIVEITEGCTELFREERTRLVSVLSVVGDAYGAQS